MKRKFVVAAGVAMVASLALSSCSGESADDGAEAGGPVTISMSGWSLATTPEFQVLADGYMAKNPDVTVELKEYDPLNYNTLLTADLAAGSGPDVIVQKEVKFVSTFQEGAQLVDVSDVELPEDIGGTEAYDIDGASYAVPYRQDSWVVFYNKALFDQAGMEYPDGSWTWDDYADTEEDLATALAGTGAFGGYQHGWQSTVQGFANAQVPDADILSGEFGHLEEYYERVLALQDDKAQVDFNTRNANQLTYQGEFGKQKAAMLPMGSWFVATLIAQQAAGEADAFDWGIAPAPQYDDSTAGIDNVPVTFGDPTGLGINAAVEGAELEAAKDFLAYAAGEEGAQSLAAIGIMPALLNDAVVETYFSVEGTPEDELSRFAISTHETLPENPTSSDTAAIQNVLLDLHTAVMSGSEPIAGAIKTAEERFKNEVDID
ncbi:carbohydrate ABC transporter substrate-binding protein (CUT1 family) [Glaciihabitans tibetensis]|uniref:Carbohydrate ABC transporter substrate-binding protein (CUT1 family) n=1 Tax=Glaciihabitans tibetensis TaxID=1266600 RepID=A0A2T0VE02_9MICO|nr:extracellular solute-binding protein [Glaciihabitans tibetensis]PRY68416.1 carbohydrate ABC transporter substrate-binding protein (CUT1 family) [Glaciihabitans tibetensis]